MHKRMLSLALCFALLLGLALPALAAPASPAPAAELTISSADEFTVFAQQCRLDSYSRDLTVTLEQDIDLSGTAFVPVPIFSGTFDGKGHTISGLTLTADGSAQGLFRYLTATAVVQNLTVTGRIAPGGSRGQIGGIAGQNEGRILNCSVDGTISGGDAVGGVAGVNTVTGLIEGCRVDGVLHGDHFVGGVAGKNNGVIRSCTNRAQINTTPQQNSVSLSDITMDTLTNTESANTVTDIGGIAGISSGVIRDCRNHGDVGYPHMGYNIGGIAGTQSGYIAGCENYGSVQGRKEIGGIVGQMEPVAQIEYSQDTLQILQGQLNTLSGLADRAAGNAKANANQIGGQIGALQEQATAARNAVDALLPGKDSPEQPDPDAGLAAQNALSAALGAMPGTMQGIAASTQNTVNGLTRDLNALSSQLSAMGKTLNHASDHLGGSIADVSDRDTPDLLTGKVERCSNHGPVLADLNAGGIAGAVAMENDLDVLEDWAAHGEESLNFESELRAVILNCENRGTVTGKKQNAGGIAGWLALGLVKDCTNMGSIDAEAAHYAGGIAGLSTGYLRSCHAKCEVRAKTYLGGIAGSATVATDCISMVQLQHGTERLGAILGEAAQSQTQDEETPVAGNLYPVLAQDPGAIDGISYAGLAEGVALEEFLALEELPELFRTVAVRFAQEDGTERRIELVPGSSLPTAQIPAIPKKEGFSAQWAGLEDADLSSIVCDMTFEAIYLPYSTTLQSRQTGANGRPLVLTEGAFTPNDTVTAEVTDAAPVLNNRLTPLGAWEICVPEGAQTIRFALPAGVDANRLTVYLTHPDGSWSETEYLVDGSYLVFAAEQTAFTLALAQQTPNWPLIGGVAAGAAALAGAAAWLVLKKRRAGDKASATAER